MVAAALFLVLLFTYGTYAQIIEKSRSLALPLKTRYIVRYTTSETGRDMIRKGIDLFCRASCFQFTPASSPDDKVGFEIRDDQPNLCISYRHQPLTVHVGGCYGPGEVAAIFFAISGLQPHQFRPDRDSHISIVQGTGTLGTPRTPPQYNTYGRYDFNSIMHAKSMTTAYTIIPRRHPAGDPRRFPSAEQYEILTRRAMGQRVMPSATDYIQLNSEHCGPLCTNNDLDCGMGGFKNGKHACRRCACSRYRSGKFCSGPPHAAANIRLKPAESMTISMNVTANNSQFSYNIQTTTRTCARPGYSIAVHFRFPNEETNLLMRDGSCQDYLSISTTDVTALREEVRMCGPIVAPLTDFYIATYRSIVLKLERDPWVKDRPAQTIVLNLKGFCVTLDTGKSEEMVEKRKPQAVPTSTSVPNVTELQRPICIRMKEKRKHWRFQDEDRPSIPRPSSSASVHWKMIVTHKLMHWTLVYTCLVVLCLFHVSLSVLIQ